MHKAIVIFSWMIFMSIMVYMASTDSSVIDRDILRGWLNANFWATVAVGCFEELASAVKATN